MKNHRAEVFRPVHVYFSAVRPSRHPGRDGRPKTPRRCARPGQWALPDRNRPGTSLPGYGRHTESHCVLERPGPRGAEGSESYGHT